MGELHRNHHAKKSIVANLLNFLREFGEFLVVGGQGLQ
jgi:hypothetical protein